MRFSKKNRYILSTIITVLFLGAIIKFAGAYFWQASSQADLKMAADLSSLSGLSYETVLKLYDAVGNWDTVRENIFVYKHVLSLTDKESYEDTFDIFGDYQAQDILAVYEFLTSNGNGFSDAPKMLQEHAKGTKWEDIMAAYDDTRIYKVYQPAGEEQVRQWLNAGYLPQDVINADSIAKAKDMQIANVLALKTDAVTWDQIGQQMEHKFNDSREKGVSLSVYDAAGTAIISGVDYASMVEKANDEAQKKERAQEDKFRSDSGLTSAQIELYKSRGFTIHDIENAFMLAKRSNNTIDKILQERLDGKSWEEIIRAYSG